MILTLKELANHLKVNERTILRMLQSGQIQGAKIGGQWRFNGTQIDRIFFPEEESDEHLPVSELLPKHLVRPASRILKHSRTILELEGETADEVLEELCDPFIQEALLPDVATLKERLKSREELLSTGVGHGVAIPHPRDPITTLREPSVLVYGRSRRGVDFKALDGQPVHHFFLICCQMIQTHLILMGRLAEILQQPDVLQELTAAESPEDVERAVLKAEASEFFGE
ncbi:MAG: PTS sugar transporter subunit IIA [bacterium]